MNNNGNGKTDLEFVKHQLMTKNKIRELMKEWPNYEQLHEIEKKYILEGLTTEYFRISNDENMDESVFLDVISAFEYYPLQTYHILFLEMWNNFIGEHHAEIKNAKRLVICPGGLPKSDYSDSDPQYTKSYHMLLYFFKSTFMRFLLKEQKLGIKIVILSDFIQGSIKKSKDEEASDVFILADDFIGSGRSMEAAQKFWNSKLKSQLEKTDDIHFYYMALIVQPECFSRLNQDNVYYAKQGGTIEEEKIKYLKTSNPNDSDIGALIAMMRTPNNTLSVITQNEPFKRV